VSVVRPVPRESYLRAYLAEAPVALALERALECEVYRGRPFSRPILDLGCGDGLFARMLFGANQWICLGLDPSMRELAAARRRGTYRLLLCARGDAIPLPNGFCRTVFSNSVLEHIPELDRVLQEVYRVLSDDGELMVTVPTDRFDHYTVGHQVLSLLGFRRLAEASSRRFNAFWRHYHCHAPEEWVARLARAGLEVVETVQYSPKVVCILHDAAVPLAFASFLTKKLFNRWTLFPPARALWVRLVYRRLERKEHVGCPDGGLVFLRAVKRRGGAR
jgi:SAM-dependent methyltransferase